MNEKSSKEWRIFKCTTCGKKHKKRIFYTGRAKFPPYRCEDCKSEQNKILSEEQEYDYDIPKELLTNKPRRQS